MFEELGCRDIKNELLFIYRDNLCSAAFEGYSLAEYSQIS